MAGRTSPAWGGWDGSEWSYPLGDGLGSVRQVTDEQGQVVQRYDYTPFGQLLFAGGTRESVHRYVGEQWDTQAGLLYLRARWYDPATGRFLTKDPFPGLVALPQTQHPYVYVGNNPVNLTDPSGEIAPILIAAGAYVGGYLAYNYLDSRVQSGVGRTLLNAAGFLTGWENVQQDWQKLANPCTSTACKLLAGADMALNTAMGISTFMGIGSGVKSIRCGAAG